MVIIFGIIALIILIVLLFSYTKNIQNAKELKKLNKSRPNLTRTEYINRLVNKGFKKRHVEVVYDKIKEFGMLDDFSMYPEDDIHVIYGIEDLDDIEMVDEICEKLNLRKAEQKDINQLNKRMKTFNAECILNLLKDLETD